MLGTIKRPEIARSSGPTLGLSLRRPYVSRLLAGVEELSVVEVLIDNYVFDEHLALLLQIGESYSLTLHCVGFSLASPEPLDSFYLNSIKRWVDLLRPSSVSDHLSWSSYQSHFFADLLPFAYDRERLAAMCRKVERIQEVLQVPFLVENVTTYLNFRGSVLTEAAFLKELCQSTGCGLLFDIQNCFANCLNRELDFDTCVEEYPLTHVGAFHVAGGSWIDNVYVDTHSTPPHRVVMEQASQLGHSYPSAPVILEFDQNLPEFSNVREILDQIGSSCIR